MTSIAGKNNPRYIIDIQSKDTRKHCHESAFMTAIHILVCFAKEYKSKEEIAAVDFDNNLELVSVWIDYMTGINWIHKNKSNDRWEVTEEGKRWIQKYHSNVIRNEWRQQ
jgi:hypothetical protein